ncbi:MAG: hypothetical protein RL266_1166 [Bacteroidota bacterium]|jgi:uncharacterized SAM-binding protein YcdF (DUF218 family)
MIDMKYLTRIVAYHVVVGVIIGMVSCGSTRTAFEKAEPHMPFDAVIVPGVPFDTAWSNVMRARVLWAYHLYTNGHTKNIIFSGSAVYTPYIEARIMAEYAKKLGVPAEHVFTEERAEHSTENVFYSYYMAKDLGFQNVALATDPFQSKMVRSFAKRKKLDLQYVPAMFDVIGVQYGGTNVTIDPSVAKVTDFVALPDREGFFKRLAGTMGKNLKYEPKEITDLSMKLR